MLRTIAMGIVMAFTLGFVGCRSCMAPYEHCQPTFIPERGDQCMGELYRCGSVLGGAERESSEDGSCESCGGGNVEYYSASARGGANGVESASASASASQIASSSTLAPHSSAEYAASEYSASPEYSAPRGASAANEYAAVGASRRSAAPNGVSPEYSTSFDENDFRLNDDGGYAVDR